MMALIALSVGVVLIVFAAHSLGYISKEKEPIKAFTNSPISPTEHLPAPPPAQIETTESKARIALIAGCILALAGGIMAAYYKDELGA